MVRIQDIRSGIAFAVALMVMWIPFAATAVAEAPAAQRGWLGIRADTLTPDVVSERNITVPFGVLVTKVRPGSPAIGSGLNEGDVIISADDTPVSKLSELATILRAKRPGETIRLGTVQSGQIKSLTVTLSERPARLSLAANTPRRGSGSPELMLETGGHMALIWMLEFTPDGRHLISASSDKVIRVWDWATGKTVRTFRGETGPGPLGRPFGLDLSPDGRTLAVVGWMHEDCGPKCGGIRFYDFESGELLEFVGAHNNITHNVKFSPDGNWLVTGNADGGVMLWDARTRRPVRLMKQHTTNVYHVDFTLDSRRIVSSSYDKTVRVWDRDTGAPLGRFTGHASPIRSMALSPNGRTLATGDRSGEVRFWDIEQMTATGRTIKTDSEAGALLFSDDGTRLLITKGIGPGIYRQRVVDVVTGADVAGYDRHRNTSFAAARHPNGRLVATGDFLGEVHVWELDTGASQAVLAGIGKSLWASGIAMDASAIAWGFTPNYKNNLRRGPLEYTLQLPGRGRRLGRPQRLQPGDENRFMQAYAGAGDLKIRHVRGGRGGLIAYDGALEVLQSNRVVATHHRGRTDGFRHRSYAVSSDAQHVITGGNNGIILKLDRHGRVQGRYRGHNSEVWTLTPSADSRMLVTGSADQTIRFWNLKTRELLASLFHAPGGAWVMWTPQGFYTGSPDAGALVGWQINKGDQSEAEYVYGEQYRRTLRRPDIVERALLLLSAERATNEAFPNGFDLQALLSGRPPVIDIMTPEQNRTVTGGRTRVSIRVDNRLAPVESFEIFVNGRKVKADEVPIPTDHPRPPDGWQVHMFDVPLFEGVNDVAIVAANEFGTTPVDANVLRVRHNGEGALDVRGTLHIVAIGVDRYPGLGNTCVGPDGQPTASCDLRFAGKDASVFADTLQRQMGPRHETTRTYLLVNDGVGPDAIEPTAANIRATMDQISAANPNDTVVVFLAGHGEQGFDGRYYFLPTDIERDGMSAAGQGKNILEWSTIQGALTTALGRRILFVDACQSGTANSERAANDQLLSDARAEKFVAFAATAPEQLAEERPDLGHGLFTYALVQGLKGGALDERERAIRVYGLGGYLSSKVRELSNGRQTPEFYSGHGDIVLVRK